MSRIKQIVGAAVVAAALVAPASASASYSITQHQAEINALDAAETLYAGNDVTADDSWCHPQGVLIGEAGSRYRGRYHRWSCFWTGTDGDYADVYGVLRITGHTGNRYGYLAVYGGMKWA